jgi:uncharacterized DUF497 family protein
MGRGQGAANARKHGVTFEEASTVFDDVDLLVNLDPADPTRFIAVGFSAVARVLLSFTRSGGRASASFRRGVLPSPRSSSMPNAEDSDLEIPELTTEWFQSAAQPNRRGLHRGTKRAVFIESAIANRFGSDEELERALKALLEASDHVRKAG